MIIGLGNDLCDISRVVTDGFIIQGPITEKVRSMSEEEIAAQVVQHGPADDQKTARGLNS